MERGAAVDSVWLLIHDDRSYDMGDVAIRGVYATEQAAKDAVVTRTPSGRRSTAYGAHDEHCCSVDEWPVEGEAKIDIREDDPPPDPNAPRLIPDDLVDATLAMAVRPFPVWDKLHRG